MKKYFTPHRTDINKSKLDFKIKIGLLAIGLILI